MKVETLAENLLFTTVRIHWSSKPEELHTGTGFFYAYRNGDEARLFIVTNRHVVDGAKDTTITFHTAHDGSVQLGKPFELTVVGADKYWYASKDPNVDLAIGDAGQLFQALQVKGVKPFWKHVDQSLTLDSKTVAQLDALEEVVFVGYPAPVWDTHNFLPVIRRGITATPVAIDYLGQKQFLVDASVFPGSSGSPVFLFNKGAYADRNGGTTIGSRIIFLGVIAAVHQQQEVNKLQFLPLPTGQVPAVVSNRLINLGIVFRASTVVDLIEECLVSQGVKLVAPTEQSLRAATVAK